MVRIYLSNDVDSARTSRHEIRAFVVYLAELLEQRIPSCRLLLQCIFWINLCQTLRLRHCFCCRDLHVYDIQRVPLICLKPDFRVRSANLNMYQPVFQISKRRAKGRETKIAGAKSVSRYSISARQVSRQCPHVRLPLLHIADTGGESAAELTGLPSTFPAQSSSICSNDLLLVCSRRTQDSGPPTTSVESLLLVACSKAPFSTCQRMVRLGDEFKTPVNGTGTSLSSDWKGNGCGMIDQLCYALYQEYDD